MIKCENAPEESVALRDQCHITQSASLYPRCDYTNVHAEQARLRLERVVVVMAE
jgi:hypothetical protein